VVTSEPLEVCFGATGAITRISGGGQQRVVSGLPSLAAPDGSGGVGPHDLALRNNRRAYVVMGLTGPPDLRDELGSDGTDFGRLLEVDLPGSLTEDALKDPALSETLVTSAVAEFECGFVDYMRYPGQWFEEWQNSSQSRPDALSQFRSQLVGVYADPCASGTGPIWTTMQVPRGMCRRRLPMTVAGASASRPGRRTRRSASPGMDQWRAGPGHGRDSGPACGHLLRLQYGGS